MNLCETDLVENVSFSRSVQKSFNSRWWWQMWGRKLSLPVYREIPRGSAVITVSILSCSVQLGLYISVTENKVCTSQVNTKQRQNCTLSERCSAWALIVHYEPVYLSSDVMALNCHSWHMKAGQAGFRLYGIEVCKECSLRWIKLLCGTRQILQLSEFSINRKMVCVESVQTKRAQMCIYWQFALRLTDKNFLVLL